MHPFGHKLEDTPPTAIELQEDMSVQLFIGSHCIQSIKRNLNLNNKSAYAMWTFLEKEYGQTGQR